MSDAFDFDALSRQLGGLEHSNTKESGPAQFAEGAAPDDGGSPVWQGNGHVATASPGNVIEQNLPLHVCQAETVWAEPLPLAEQMVRTPTCKRRSEPPNAPRPQKVVARYEFSVHPMSSRVLFNW